MHIILMGDIIKNKVLIMYDTLVNLKTSPMVKRKRIANISKVGRTRKAYKPQSRVALIKGATVNGISVRNKINKRRDVVRTAINMPNFQDQPKIIHIIVDNDIINVDED